MSIKYFHYISKTKVDMLLGQFRQSCIEFPTITPKIEFAGIGLEAEVKSSANVGLIKDTSKLIQLMSKKNLIKPLGSDTEIDNDSFWQDNNDWFNGLFTFWAEPAIVTYLLWRTFNDSIILLVGSPLNVLGNKTIREGVWAPSSFGTWQFVYEFVNSHFKLDEDILVIDPNQRTLKDDQISLEECEQTKLSKFTFDVSPDVKVIRKGMMGFTIIAGITPPTSHAFLLGLFCVKYLSTLPQSRIETVFKIFYKDNLKLSGDLPDWFKLNKSNSESLANIEKYRRVSVGSPIYTATL